MGKGVRGGAERKGRGLRGKGRGKGRDGGRNEKGSEKRKEGGG